LGSGFSEYLKYFQLFKAFSNSVLLEKDLDVQDERGFWSSVTSYQEKKAENFEICARNQFYFSYLLQ